MIGMCTDSQSASTRVVNDIITSNNETNTVVEGTQESPLVVGTRILDHDHVFWMGDLNYRIDECKCVRAFPFNVVKA